jgi:hypothetical protein
MTDFTLNLTHSECDIVEAALVRSVRQWDGKPETQGRADAAREVIKRLLCRYTCILVDESIVTDDPLDLFGDDD